MKSGNMSQDGMSPDGMSQDGMSPDGMSQDGMSQDGMSHGGMYFHTNVMNTILFAGWHTMTWQELLGSCIGVAIIAALYEGFKVGRDLIDIRMSKKSYQVAKNQYECSAYDQTSTRTTGDSTVIAIGDDNEAEKTKSRPAIISLRHIIQTGLHFIQLWIGFCLMLIFMTFSVYLCLAITVGGAVGYFCFAWLRTRPHSDYPSYNSAECCN